MRLRVILGVVLLATPASLAIAQITSATISGTVKDQTGAPLPGVDIVVKNLETGLTRGVVTDSNGYFALPSAGQVRGPRQLAGAANFSVPTRQVFAGATQDEAPLATPRKVLRTANSSRQVQLGIKVLF